MKQLNLEELEKLLKQNNIRYFSDAPEKPFLHLDDGRVIEAVAFNLSYKAFEDSVSPEECILKFLQEKQHSNFHLMFVRDQITVSTESEDSAYKNILSSEKIRAIDPETFGIIFLENVYENYHQIVRFFSY